MHKKNDILYIKTGGEYMGKKEKTIQRLYGLLELQKKNRKTVLWRIL